MENKVRVTLTAEIGGYEVDMKTWDNENYLRHIFIKKITCPQLVFQSPIIHSLNYEATTFDYEIKDGILVISHIVKKIGKSEEKKIICQIATSFIDAFAEIVTSCLNAIPEDLGIVCKIETCDVNGDISGSIDKDWEDDDTWYTSSSTFFLGGTEKTTLSTWISNEYEWHGNKFEPKVKERPGHQTIVESFDKTITEKINFYYESLLRERRIKHDRESYVHTDADKKAFLFCHEYGTGCWQYIGLTEDGLILWMNVSTDGYEQSMKKLAEFLYESHWTYRPIYKERGDEELLRAFEKGFHNKENRPGDSTWFMYAAKGAGFTEPIEQV